MSLPKPSFPDGLGDAVLNKLRLWGTGYEKGSPINPRAVPIPDHPDFEARQRVVDGYKHKIPFRLNQLNYLESVLDYITQDLPATDPRRVVFTVIQKARVQHEQLQDSKRIGVNVEHDQSYSFQKSHVEWMYMMVFRHKTRMIEIAVDPKQATADIKKADW